jgi:hypothetical protein
MVIIELKYTVLNGYTHTSHSGLPSMPLVTRGVAGLVHRSSVQSEVTSSL